MITTSREVITLKDKLLRKSIVFGIIVLFLGAGFLPNITCVGNDITYLDDGEAAYIIRNENNNPPEIPSILAHPYGKPGIRYNFRTQLIDPDEDAVFCMWDWGDDSYSDWLGPFESGKFISTGHAWSEGSFEIKVKAKDVHGAESNWSEILTLTIENEPPEVKILQPTKALYVLNRKILPRKIRKTLILGKIDITVDAKDDSGIKKVEFYIDNELKSVDESKPYSYTWTRDKIKVLDHRYSIKVIAFDNAGNQARDDIKVRKFL